jgi:hypothetical protein
MSGGSWRPYRAAGGWLTAVLAAVLISTAGVWGQGAWEPPGPEGIAQSPPSDTSAAQGQEQKSERGSENFALPVRVVDDAKQSQNAREYQQRTEQHDAKDLIAQQLAADAASRSAAEASIQTGLIRLQTYTVIFGTAVALGGASMLWFTLRWTRRTAEAGIRSADAAHAAVELAHDTSRRQLRAYVAFQHCDVSIRQTPYPQADILFVNRGQTPARVSRQEIHWFIAERRGGFIESALRNYFDVLLGPGDPLHIRTTIPFDVVQIDSMARAPGGATLYMAAVVGYFDIYDRPYTVRAVAEYKLSTISPMAGRMGDTGHTDVEVSSMQWMAARQGGTKPDDDYGQPQA